MKLINWYKRHKLNASPQMNLVLGFLVYTIVGFLLLSLPFLHKGSVGFLDNLFISTSAVSTTGLVTVGVYESYNFFGQLVIAILIQLGGIGYMTLTTYYILLTTNRITKWHTKLIGTEFTLPQSIALKDFVKSIIIFTIVMESLGAIGFYISFSTTDMSTFDTIWFSIFHSISAFCTAGFALFGDGFESFRNDTFVNVVISVLAIAGSLGFILITDMWYRITGKSESITFTSKIVLVGFLVLLTFGTLVTYFSEPIVSQSGQSGLLQSFFLAMTSMTTVGFNTIPTGELSLSLIMMVLFLMYIGASPSGTAGGMKITTLTAMISVLKSRLFGEKKITFMNRIIPFERLYIATSTFIFYTSLIFLFTFLLSFSESFSFDKILFEVASSLGTVGLSTGITGDLTSFGKSVIILVMFIGRVGVLTFGFALLERKRKENREHLMDDIAV